MQRICFVYGGRADRHRWLEYVRSPALREPLAGLIGFDSPFRSEDKCEEKAYPPPAAAIAKVYRAQALTSTVLQPALSDLTVREKVESRQLTAAPRQRVSAVIPARSDKRRLTCDG
jgi:hypothetical protein